MSTVADGGDAVGQREPLPVERYLRELVARCPEAPLIDDLTDDDLGTPCGTASIVRAALAWSRSKTAAVIRADLERDLRDEDTLARARWRLASYDLAEVDYERLAEIDRVRRELGYPGYRAPREAA